MISAEFARRAAFATGVMFFSSNPTQAHYSELSDEIRRDHAAFLEVMMSGCCYGHEVVHNVKQTFLPGGGYNVIIPAGAYPGQTSAKSVNFTWDQVKDRKEIEADCRLLYAATPDKLKTCTAVPYDMNIIFVEPTNFTPYCMLPRIEMG